MKLSSAYEPGQYETDIYALWEKSGAFVPKNRGNDGYFSLVMPPPNANANMHIGTGKQGREATLTSGYYSSIVTFIFKELPCSQTD